MQHCPIGLVQSMVIAEAALGGPGQDTGVRTVYYATGLPIAADLDREWLRV